jgi:hypothetical protein
MKDTKVNIGLEEPEELIEDLMRALAGWRLMKRMMFLGLMIFLLSWTARPASAEGSMRYIHHGDPIGDTRNLYAWRLLQAALDQTRPVYGDFVLTTSPLIDERPNGLSLLTEEGGITVSVFSSRAGYSGELIPVRIPIDRGLLGYRLLLIRATDQPEFDAVAKGGNLRAIRFGALVSWSDVAIMRNAGLAVVTGESFDGLFKMLAARRFDALTRGAGEIQREVTERRKDFHGLAIEQSLLLHYPMPVYFWFRNAPEGRRLAERVDAGLHAMLANGSFDTLFHQEFDPILTGLDFTHRHVIELDNPLLAPDEPLEDRTLWYFPQRKTD